MEPKNDSYALHRAVRAALGDRKATQDEITKALADAGLEGSIDPGEYADFLYAAAHDAKMSVLMPDVMAVLAAIRYVPEAGTPDEADEARRANDAIMQNVRQTIEDAEIPMQLVDNVKSYAMNAVSLIEAATRVINRKASECLNHAMCAKAGTEELHTGHFRDYAQEIFKRAQEGKDAA
jgi:hypothetical protein